MASPEVKLLSPGRRTCELDRPEYGPVFQHVGQVKGCLGQVCRSKGKVLVNSIHV